MHELGADKHLVASGIEVSASAGVVQLDGAVQTWPARERAGLVTAVASGVRAVVNRVRIVPVWRPDAVVAADVRAELHRTAALSGVPITARVTDGIVELSGSISSWDEQQLAERVAGSVPGVRFCQNQLTSHGPRTRTPAVIARDIQSRLDWDPLLEHAPIRVSVRASRVFLAGRVGSPLERRQAVVASRVRGVSAVDARALVVDATHRPDPNLRVSFPSDAEISTTIQDLASHWPAAATNVSTTVVAGVVTFNGTVPNLL
jgi:osmotically-inducible protein OsmY